MKEGSLALVALSLAAAAHAQPAPTPTASHHDRAPSEIFRRQPLSGNVHALFGRGGNVGFFVSPDAVLVVDSQFKDIAPGIVEQIQKVTDRPIKYLLNTHHHGDHVGGNEVFKQFASSSPRNVRQADVSCRRSRSLKERQRSWERGRQGTGEVERLEKELEWARK